MFFGSDRFQLIAKCLGTKNPCTFLNVTIDLRSAYVTRFSMHVNG